MLILARTRTWIEQALSFILSLRNKNSSHCLLDIIQNCNLNENFVVYECFLAEPKTAWVANSF